MGSQFAIFQVFVILGVTVILFLIDVVRVDVVAIIVLILLGLSRILAPEQLFSGFSSEAAISFIGIMIITGGLERSGITNRLARWILRISHEHQYRIILLLMLMPGVMAGFMRSVGTTALFLPVVGRIALRTGMSRSRLLMPLGFASILGGALTMVGSSSLIVLNGLLNNINQNSKTAVQLTNFGLFDIFPVGACLLIVGMIYLYFAREWLPEVQKNRYNAGTPKAQFLKTYGKGGDIFEVKIQKDSPICGNTLQGIEEILDPLLSVVAIRQSDNILFPPLRRTKVDAGDRLAIMGSKEKVSLFAEKYNLKLYPKLEHFAETLHSSRAGLCEAVIPPASSLIGQKVSELHMRRNYQMHVVALYRGVLVYQGDSLKQLSLHSGDTLGMYSRWSALADLSKNSDFVVVTTSYPQDRTQPEKIPQALAFFLLSIILIVGFKFPISVSLLVGAAGMIASGVITIDEAYNLVSWKTIFLLAGLIPLGLAMQVSGAIDWVTGHVNLIPYAEHSWTIQILLAVVSTASALFISNIGATVLLVPIAVDLALELGQNPKLFAIIVALSSSNTFLLPTNQVNALIMGPGSYTNADFLKIGIGMTIIFWVVTLVGVNLMF